MSFRKSTLGLTAGLTLTMAALAAAPSPASAASALCGGGGHPVMAAQHVSVLDSPSTFPASCVRFATPYVQANGSTWITYYGTQLRDTAHDDQVAVVLVRLGYASGAVSPWQQAQPPTGTESWANPWHHRSWPTQGRPNRVEFAACRSTSWSGTPTNACAFGTFWV